MKIIYLLLALLTLAAPSQAEDLKLVRVEKTRFGGIQTVLELSGLEKTTYAIHVFKSPDLKEINRYTTVFVDGPGKLTTGFNCKNAGGSCFFYYRLEKLPFLILPLDSR